MKYKELCINIDKKDEDNVMIYLNDNDINNMIIEDPNDIEDFKNRQNAWDLFDDDINNLEEGRVLLKIYFDDIDEKMELINKISKELKEKFDLNIKINNIDDSDWENNWKKYFKVYKISDKLVIKPSWEDYDKKDDEVIIELDPGMAFGTGTHESTKLCLQKIEKYIKRDDLVLDVGTGSGILSIASVLLGAKKATGLDIDPGSIYIAKNNASVNKVSDKTEFFVSDLLSKATGKYDIIVSNIIAEVIVSMIKDLKNYMTENSYFISSGILSSKADMVEVELKNNGFIILEREILNEWAAVVAKYNA